MSDLGEKNKLTHQLLREKEEIVQSRGRLLSSAGSSTLSTFSTTWSESSDEEQYAGSPRSSSSAKIKKKPRSHSVECDRRAHSPKWHVSTTFLNRAKAKGLRLSLSETDFQKRAFEVKARVQTEIDKHKAKVKDHLKKDANVRMVDKFSFTLGVLNLAITEFILIKCPQHFWAWFGTMMPILLIIRNVMYRRIKLQYFTIDFCYFSCFLCHLSIFVFPDCAWLWRTNFVFANGPLAIAIVAWRNSLVFHSLDKITSVYIHAMPSLLTFTVRWSAHWNNGATPYGHICEDETGTISLTQAYLLPLGMYFLWQLVYYLKVEVSDRAKLDNDPTLQTSLRWLAKDTSNGMNKMTLKIMRRWGVMTPDEQFDPQSTKTKLIFMFAQLVFTLTGMLATPFLFRSVYFHAVYLTIIYSWCAYNGASYYIESFSKHYQKKFERHSMSSNPTPENWDEQ